MFISDVRDCAEFLAGDSTHLREILHPDKAPLAIRYSLAHAVVKPGETSLRHRLRTSEVYYILEGEGLMRIGDESRQVGPGQAVYIPPGQVQCIHNAGGSDLKFLCIVDPAWRLEDEVVEEEDGRRGA
jgi:mannose-6-phosphate isomerase-like protein (cupin superfamily)